MKQLLAICSAALLATAASAQPTLTAATNTPLVGTSFAVNFGPYVQPGSAGPNRTWDLSTLSIDSSLTAQYINASNTPHSAQFPNATIAEVNDLVAQYYRVASDGIHFAGSDDGESVIVHAPQGTYLPFPCTFGTSWSSPQNATFLIEESEVIRTGTFTGQVDGYGTLVMPGGSIPNVLRVHWTHVLQDDLGFFAIDHTYDSYAYFVAGQAWPIAELLTSTIDFGGGTQTSQFSRWSADLSTNIQARSPVQASVFPNPTTGILNVTWPNDFGTRAAVSVVDMVGRSVMLGQYHLDANSTQAIDLQAFHSGTYELVILGENGKRTSTSFIIQ